MGELAWAAGLFEGEGCISVSRRGDRPSPAWVLVLGMTDEDAVRAFHCIVGVGTVYCRKEIPNHCRAMWIWRCGSRNDIAYVLASFLPFLNKRRTAKAREALNEIAELQKSTNGRPPRRRNRGPGLRWRTA